jgi:DNA-directed RNA polymerase specialized sigma24 family protein
MELIQRALAVAIAALTPRDRLRLASYYTHQLTLAQTGQVLGEHEATVSRQLNRTRLAIREYVERYLTREAGLHDDQVSRCFECALEDPGALDLADLIRKES